LRHGYLDLLGGRLGELNVANLTNLLPGAGRLYEPLWRVRSLSLLTGERFPNGRELDVISELLRSDGAAVGGLYLDLGCSAGLYSRELPGRLGDGATHFVGVDISPSMLEEADRRAGDLASLVRADVQDLPFADGTFRGAACGGSLNEIKDPLKALRETRRVLEPGARLAIMGISRAQTPRGERLQRLLSTGGLRFFEGDELRSLLDHAGFEPDPLRVFGPIFFAGATRR
jgi:SAM-dependent methyltransferase